MAVSGSGLLAARRWASDRGHKRLTASPAQNNPTPTTEALNGVRGAQRTLPSGVWYTQLSDIYVYAGLCASQVAERRNLEVKITNRRWLSQAPVVVHTKHQSFELEPTS